MPAGRYDLVIVGGGPAGLVAARAAAALGIKVAVVERDLLGGTSLNTGSIPSKTFLHDARVNRREGVVDFQAAMRRLQRVRARLARRDSVRHLTELGIEVFHGHARFTAGDRVSVEGTELTFDKAMIATGSRPRRPSLPGLDQAGYLTNESVFELTDLPRRLLVIGGGPLGCELAQAFCRLGVKTIIVQQPPLFLPREERDAAQILSDAFARDGLEVRLNTRVVGVRVESAQKQVDLVSDDSRSTVSVDEILAATGRAPNVEELGLEVAGVDHDAEAGIRVDDFLRTSNPRIFAAGDVCLEHQFTHVAEASARIVVENALRGGRRRWSSMTIPWCTFTDPEIAHVGLHVREARERDLPVKTFTVPMHDVDRAVTDAEDVGFVKIHVEERGDRILGATIVGRHAGEMINEITLAIVAGVGLGKLAQVIHPYPTQAAGIQLAAEAYLRTLPPSRRRAR
jgi:pyruvate/2-oxoglutarate dehydrogenase complex dihydrolipoamide dehydrogenase (E3) component